MDQPIYQTLPRLYNPTRQPPASRSYFPGRLSAQGSGFIDNPIFGLRASNQHQWIIQVLHFIFSFTGSIPITQLSVKLLQPSPINRALWRKSVMIIGLNTFSSKCPFAPPTEIATSFPITWCRNHCQRFTLGRIHFTRHDGRIPVHSPADGSPLFLPGDRSPAYGYRSQSSSGWRQCLSTHHESTRLHHG